MVVVVVVIVVVVIVVMPAAPALASVGLRVATAVGRLVGWLIRRLVGRLAADGPVDRAGGSMAGPPARAPDWPVIEAA